MQVSNETNTECSRGSAANDETLASKQASKQHKKKQPFYNTNFLTHVENDFIGSLKYSVVLDLRHDGVAP